jgi:hypothetical protein
MNYEKKYLKYKEKYLFFKNQYGGAKIGDIIYKLVEPGKNNLMGKIIGENDAGIIDREGVHTGPIWIYWNTTTLKEGYLKKRKENKKWAVASSIEGLGQPKAGKSGYDPYILDSVPSVPARVQPSSAAQASPSGFFSGFSKLWKSSSFPEGTRPSSAVAEDTRPSSAVAEGPTGRYIYIIDWWGDELTEYGGLITVIANSNSECFQILQSNFNGTPAKIKHAIDKSINYELKNNQKSGIVRSFSA